MLEKITWTICLLNFVFIDFAVSEDIFDSQDTVNKNTENKNSISDEIELISPIDKALFLTS